MRSGTLVLLVAVNAVIAVGVVAVALTVVTPTPSPIGETTTAARSDVSSVDLQKEIRELRQDLGGQISQLGEALADEREKSNALREKLAKLEESGVAPAGEGEAGTEAADREAASRMMRGFATASRRMGRQVLEQLANPTEDSVRQAENRVRRDAQRLGRRLNLSEARTAQVEQALLDVDRRTRSRMQDAINTKGIDNVTFEDAKPIVEESFQERERAMESVLTNEEMGGFKEQEQQSKAMVDMGMRMIFPAPPTEESGR